jgi:hypothetical protein
MRNLRGEKFSPGRRAEDQELIGHTSLVPLTSEVTRCVIMSKTRHAGTGLSARSFGRRQDNLVSAESAIDALFSRA